MTLTHQISSSANLKLYAAPFKSSQVLGEVLSNSQVQLLEEQVGLNCAFLKIETDIGVGYIENAEIEYSPLRGEYQTAPSICPTKQINLSFVEPDWFSLTDEQPYINDKTLEYSVCITANSYSIDLRNDSSIIESGIKALFKYYNKPYDQTTINTYKNYYLFASIKDYHLSYRPFQRSKYLVSIPIKYFDAIEDSQQIDRDISNANYVLKISLKDKEAYFKNLKRTLILYRDDIFFANTTIKFNNPLIQGQEFVSVENSVTVELDMQQKIDSVEDFLIQLDNLLVLNNIQTSLTKNDSSEIVLQFALNNECNKIYNISADVNGVCRNITRGIDAFLNRESVSDPTTVNFIKNIENIYFVEVCKVPWYEFLETYLYPEIEILQPTQEPDETDYEVFLRAYKAFLVFKKTNDVNPIKTYQQIVDEFNQTLDFRTSLYADKFINLFYNQQIYQGDNFFNPTNIQKTLTTFRRIASDSGFEINNINTFAIKIGTSSGPPTSPAEAQLVEPPLGNDSEQDGWTFSTEQNKFDNPQYQIYELTPTAYVVLQDGTKKPYTLYRVTETADKTKTFNEVLDQISEIINKIGICRITDFADECLSFLLRSIDVDVDAVVVRGVLRNYKYNELINEILPYLPAEQQQFIYEELLLGLSCVNKDSLLYILRTNLTQEEYTALNLDNASYEDVVKQVSQKMVGTINE